MEMPRKLYYKDEKGRFVEYKEPQPPFNNALYRKMVYGKKVVYTPISMCVERDLGEGVWVVTKNIYGKSFSSGRYLNDSFMCLKASDIQETPLSKLGGMEKLANWLCHNWEKLPKDKSLADLCRAIVGVLFQYENRICCKSSEQGNNECLQTLWYYPEKTKPQKDRNCLIEMIDGHIYIGYWDGKTWFWYDGFPVGKGENGDILYSSSCGIDKTYEVKRWCYVQQLFPENEQK